MSSSRERNDRSPPSFKGRSKPASKGPPKLGGPVKAAPKPAPGREPAGERLSTDNGKPWAKGAEGRPRAGKPDGRGRRDNGQAWLWGWHAVAAALNNPRREGFKRLLVAPAKSREVEAAADRLNLTLELLEPNEIARVLPSGAVHQGVALLAEPVEPEALEAFADAPSGVLLMLDQLTDPQNIGAIFRSAAAFGARGLILQDRHAPELTGALAKAAAGAIDALPHARVVNLSRALRQLTEAGWRAVGLDGEAADTLETVLDERPTVLVLGSEGEGLRRLVAEHCDALGRIPMPGGFESLNVSAAAAIALYEASKAR